jgi:4-amino-4-deoxy-L-arabinose transferase-like glycosyltransferase
MDLLPGRPVSARTKILFTTVYALWVAFILVLASVPPVSRDALTHHLAVPKLWIEGGGLIEIPHVLFSYYPQLLDLLYTIPLLAGHDIAAKYIHFLFAALTALLIFRFVRRRLSASWGALAGIMFLTVPLVAKLSVTVYVDLGLMFFTMAALYSAVLWLEDASRMKWLLIAAVCSGLALSTKYNAMVSFVVLSLLLPFFYLNTRQIKTAEQFNTVKFGVIFVCVSMLVFSPWLIRNLALTGNPLYPLQPGPFKVQVVETDTIQAATTAEEHAGLVTRHELGNQGKSLGPLLTRKFVHEESLPYTLLIPARIFFEGKDDDPKFFDGRLNPLLLILPLLLIYFGRRVGLRPVESSLFGYYALLMVLLVFLTKDMRLRWVATIVPPLVVLATYSLYAMRRCLLSSGRSERVANLVTAAAVSVYLLPNLSYAASLWAKVEPMPYVTGEQSYEDYRHTHLPEYGVVAAANRAVPDGGKLLVLYMGNRGYYFSVDAFPVNAVFTYLAETAASGQALGNRLRELGYTHVMVHDHLFVNRVESADEATQARVAEFVGRRLVPVAMENGFSLYRITPP